MKIDYKKIKLERIEHINKEIILAAKKKDKAKLRQLNYEKNRLIEQLGEDHGR